MRGPNSTSVTHRLTDAELTSLAQGRFTVAIADRLRAAEQSKHRLLVEAVRRQAERTRPPGDLVMMNAAMRLLGQVEAYSAEIVANILALPHVGSWAIGCLHTMAAGGGADQTDGGRRAPLRSDLGYLAAITAAAALRACYPFDLKVPLHDGILLLPGLGMARLDSDRPWDCARVRLDRNGALASSQSCVVALPTGLGTQSRADPRWSPTPRLRTRADGLDLDVALDACDPFLARVGTAAALSVADLAKWQLLAGEAWQILVRHHRVAAKVFAAVVSTLVPLMGMATHPTSATSGWAFGAIGLSLPTDGLSLAETFVHELQHLVLGAVEDMVPLVDHEREDRLGYAPWRDDPRPTASLLQGCYAYLAVTAFWRQQRRAGGPTQRLRGAVEFARWRRATLDAATALAGSPALTETGIRFVTGIRQPFARWQGDLVPAEAEHLAAEVSLAHRVRWRLACARPAAATIDALASAWQSGDTALAQRETALPVGALQTPDGPAPSETVLGRVDVPVTIESPPRRRLTTPEGTLAHLLEARYRDPARLRRLLEVRHDASGPSGEPRLADKADAALLRGDNATAVRCYVRRLGSADDDDAWAGLAVVLQRIGPHAPARMLAERPEVAAAMHARLLARQGDAPDVLRLLDWLARALVILS